MQTPPNRPLRRALAAMLIAAAVAAGCSSSGDSAAADDPELVEFRTEIDQAWEEARPALIAALEAEADIIRVDVADLDSRDTDTSARLTLGITTTQTDDRWNTGLAWVIVAGLTDAATDGSPDAWEGTAVDIEVGSFRFECSPDFMQEVARDEVTQSDFESRCRT